MDRPWSFRRAQLQDVAAIVALVESAYRGDVSRAGWTTEADLLDGQRTDADEVAALVSGTHSRIVLAHAEGSPDTLVGSIMFEQASDVVHAGMLAVRPSLQAQGIGRALLAEVERLVQAERLGTRLQLTVIAQRTELIAWYARRDYHLTAETRPFPYGELRFGLPRRSDLYFSVLEKVLRG